MLPLKCIVMNTLHSFLDPTVYVLCRKVCEYKSYTGMKNRSERKFPCMVQSKMHLCTYEAEMYCFHKKTFNCRHCEEKWDYISNSRNIINKINLFKSTTLTHILHEAALNLWLQWWCRLEIVRIKLLKGKAPRKNSLHKKIAASVLLKMFISANENATPLTP